MVEAGDKLNIHNFSAAISQMFYDTTAILSGGIIRVC